MRANRILTGSVLMVVAFVFAASTATFAQTEKTPSQTYMEYHAALQKAKTIDAIASYMSAARKKEVDSAPADMKTMALGMMKDGGLQPGFKIVKEEKTASGATLTLEGVDKAKTKLTATVKMVREGNAWKVADESVTNK